MTVDTAVKVEGDKCGLDMMSSCEDLPPSSVGGGGGNECNGDGKDDYVFVNGSDAASDDHVEVEGNEELNVSASNAELEGKLEGAGLSVGNGGDQLKNSSGYNGKLDNVVKVNGGGQLKHENGIAVDEESDGKAEIKREKEVVVEDEKVVVGSSNTDNVDCEIGDKGRNLEIVGKSDGDNVVKDRGSGVEKRDESDASVDGIGYPSLDDDEKVKDVQGIDSGADVVQNGDTVVEAEPLVPHVEQLEHENQVKELEKPDGVMKPEVVEGNDNPLIVDALVTNSEPVDSIIIESKPLEADVEHESQEDGITETQPPECNLKALDNEVEKSMRDDAMIENQCQQPELQPGDSKEQVPVKEEVGVREQGDLGSLGMSETQDLNAVDTEASVCELQQSAEEVKDQDASKLTTEAEECEELQAVPESEGAENQINVDLTTSEVADQADEATAELTTEPEECQELQAVPESKGAENQSNVDLTTSEVDDQADEATTKLVAEVNLTPDLNSVDVKDQDASEFATEQEECQEAQAVPVSEGAENPSNLELTASEADRPVQESIQSDEATVKLTAEVNRISEISAEDVQSDNSDKSVVDHELHGFNREGKEDLPQLGGCLESSDQEVSYQGQVAEEPGLVDAIDKEVCSEDLTSEKTITLEEPTNLSDLKVANEAVVDEEGCDASHLCDVVADNEVHVSESSNDSRSCLRSEDADLSINVGNEVDLPVACESDISKTVDNGYCAGDNDISSTADDFCSQSVTANQNITLQYPVNGSNLEVKPVNGEVDVASKTKCDFEYMSEPKISFGSFECVAPFSQSDNVNIQPGTLNRATETSTSQSEFAGHPDSIVDSANGSDANDVHSTESGHDKTCARVASSEKISTEEVSGSLPQGSGAVSSDGPLVSPPDSARRPFYYLIRIPRFDDVTLSEQIKLTDEEVQKKTQIRDDVRTEYQNRKAICWEFKTDFEDAKSEERAAHRLVIAKKREIDAAQSLINLAKNAVTVEDVDSRILEMNRTLEHETHPLAVEKMMVREIKQLRSQREHLAANTRRQQELQQALVQRVETEEQLKVLRKELDVLKDNHAKAEESFKAAKKRYDEEGTLLNDLKVKFSSADTIRQEAYTKLLTLKKQAFQKNKPFYDYKDAAKAANDLAGAGKKDSLEQHCVSQVEKFMELWNNSDEFRKEYIRCNQRSTLRRFRTLDGRSLGPDEEQPMLRNVSDNHNNNNRVNTVAKVNSDATVSTSERDFPLTAKKAPEESSKKSTEQKNKTALGKKKVEATSKDSLAEPSGRIEIEEKEEEKEKEKEKEKEVNTLTKEEEELARKEEQKRREEEAAQLKERRREEEKAKAQEALERKKRMAEKAQAKAEYKARKAAEEKEKEREKKAKKKEKKKGITSEITEIEPALVPESFPSETIREPEVSEKPATVTKKSHKPALYTKQVKTTKSITAPPAPLRNRGKRRVPQWVWWLVVVILSVILIFPLGNMDIVGSFKHFTSGPSY